MMIKLPKDAQRGRQRFFNRINQRFKALDGVEVADIQIYDEISPWGISAADVRKTLDGIDAPLINVDINSPGGNVFDGIAIHNDLQSHPAHINVRVTGVAASIASIIAMAGDTIEIAENAWFMIHNAWTFAVGDRNDLRDLADTMEEIDHSLAATYAVRTGQEIAELAAMMDKETWLVGADAVEAGFADKTTERADLSALFDLTAFGNVPGALKKQMEQGLREAGYSRQDAAIAMARGFHVLRQREVDAGPQREAALEEFNAPLDQLRAAIAA